MVTVTDVAMRRRIGFLPESFQFYSWMTPGELLDFHGRLCGLTTSQLRTRIPTLIELVGLAPHREKRLEAFSKGMLQRIGLAQALVNEPEVIFLDEPTKVARSTTNSIAAQRLLTLLAIT